MPINPTLPADGSTNWGQPIRSAIGTIVNAVNANETAIQSVEDAIGAAGTAGGIATLDSSGKVPESQIPATLLETRTTVNSGRLSEASLNQRYQEGGGILRSTLTNLPRWTKARLLSQIGHAPARVLCVGDGTTAGVQSDSFTTALGSGNQGGPGSYPARLAEFLRTSGIPAHYALAIPGNATSPDPRWTLGDWAYSTATIGAGGAAAITASSGSCTLTPGVPADSYRVYYLGGEAVAAFTAQAGGGGTVTIDTTQPSPGIYVSDVITAASASAGNEVTFTVASGNPLILGVEWWDSANPTGTRVMNAGVAGALATTWAQDIESDTQGGKAFIRASQPDLTIISLGVADAEISSPTELVTDAVLELATVAAESGDVLLVSAVPHDAASRVDDYNAAYRMLTLPYVDLAHRYGHSMMEMGLQTEDATHPNGAGYADMAHVIARALLQ